MQPLNETAADQGHRAGMQAQQTTTPRVRDLRVEVVDFPCCVE
jgi:hypothetical protein